MESKYLHGSILPVYSKILYYIHLEEKASRIWYCWTFIPSFATDVLILWDLYFYCGDRSKIGLTQIFRFILHSLDIATCRSTEANFASQLEESRASRR